MNIIGQEKLLRTLDNYNIFTLPKTMLFLGEEGCGKHLVAKTLANRLQLKTVIIDDKVTADTLIEYNQSPIKTLYILDLTKFTTKDQNKFLKFIEEPAASVHIIVLANSELGLLPTILNRCLKYTFEPYTIDQLKEFSWMIGSDVDELVFKVCKTPGQLAGVDPKMISELSLYCNNLIDNIDKFSYQALMDFVLRVNYAENYDKYDFDLFFRVLEYISADKYIKENKLIAMKIYLLTKEALQNKMNKSVAKEAFMFNFLNKLWEVAR